MNEDQNCIMLYSLKYLGGVSIIKLKRLKKGSHDILTEESPTPP